MTVLKVSNVAGTPALPLAGTPGTPALAFSRTPAAGPPPLTPAVLAPPEPPTAGGAPLLQLPSNTKMATCGRSFKAYVQIDD
jgi:hypothetical protein